MMISHPSLALPGDERSHLPSEFVQTHLYEYPSLPIPPLEYVCIQLHFNDDLL